MSTLKLRLLILVISLVTTVVAELGVGLSNPVLAQSVERSTNQPLSRLKSGDRIRLTVTGFPEFSGEQLIMADGTLQFPLAGAVAIAGQTPAEAVATITTALQPYIRRPQVGLAILSVRPPRISVIGEVLRPGPRPFTPPDLQEVENSLELGNETFQTVSYALVLAGGVTPNADIRNITIRRLVPNPQDPSQATRTEIKVDLWNAIQTGELDYDPQVIDGDEILVPTAQVSSADQQQLLSSTIAPNLITVRVAGSVRNAGSVEISPSDGVNEAIAAAGGLTNDASDNLTLLRVAPDGTLDRREVAFGESSEPLRNGDVIVASRSSFDSVLDAVGTLLSPITTLFYLFR
jgi:polysaccharide biosynthesis/export protein